VVRRCDLHNLLSWVHCSISTQSALRPLLPVISFQTLKYVFLKDWQANFEISEATNLILKDNVAAGGERLCFHMDGEACDAPDETAWSGATSLFAKTVKTAVFAKKIKWNLENTRLSEERCLKYPAAFFLFRQCRSRLPARSTDISRRWRQPVLYDTKLCHLQSLGLRNLPPDSDERHCTQYSHRRFNGKIHALRIIRRCWQISWTFSAFFLELPKWSKCGCI